MDYPPRELLIRVHIAPGSRPDPRALLDALEPIETTLYRSDRADVLAAGRELGVPQVLIDASLERIRHYRHQRLRIDRAATGSLVLEGAVVAVGLWILRVTIGEAFQQAIQDTRSFARLTGFFRDNLDRKVSFIVHDLRKSIRQPGVQAEVRYQRAEGDQPHLISVIVAPERLEAGTQAPTVGQVVQQSRPDA